MSRTRFAAAYAVLLSLLLACAHAPPSIPLNHRGLPVVGDRALYQQLVTLDPGKRMEDLRQIDPSIVLDIRYATADNFMKRVLYPAPRAFLRAPAAAALREVQRELRPLRLGLKVFDAYRPYRITEEMWERFKDPDYVADPARGSRHNRGAAVDVTLINLDSGAELPMPTPYDDFTPRAAHAFNEVDPGVAANRARLRQVMERHGFVPLPSEWWHYDFAGWEKFELMDLSFDQLG